MLEEHRAQEADAVLASLLASDPRNTDLLFLSGMVAMERDDHQRAIRLFRAILIDHPKAERVRLELGRAFFVAGDYGNAARQFQFASAGHPPPVVQANIDKYLYAIRQAKALSYSLDLSLAPDSNLNGGSSSREVTLYGLPFDLSDEAQRHSGVGAQLGATGEWAPHLGANSRLRLGASLQRREYSGSRFDDMTAALYAGPRFVMRRWDLSLLATASRRWYGARPYDVAAGGRITATYYVTPQVGLTTDLSVQTVRYDAATHLTGLLSSLGETIVYALTPSSGVVGRAGISRTRARADAYANWSGYLAAGYFRDLPAGFSAYVETSLAVGSYDASLPAFGARRVDLASSTMINLLNRHIVLSRFTPRLSYSYTYQHSTIPLYSFDRNRVELGLTTTF
nr:surface lipoprotein assembly modifier [Sphingobium nicotianae]